MSGPRILFAHERRGVARAVQRVLERKGFEVECVSDGDICAQRLSAHRWAGFVIDVALPKRAGYELVEFSRQQGPKAGAQVIVLVASVYRRTSYKRSPTRLYGADDYVEIHHLCDSLPRKLCEHLKLSDDSPTERAEAEAREQLRLEGDTRMEDFDADYQRLAALIVADMVLYNGDALHGSHDLSQASRAVAPDLDIARQLFAQVVAAEGGTVPDDPIGEAFTSLMRVMGREERVP